MLAVSFSTMRNNLKSYCDKAVKENEDVIVTRKNAEYLAKIDRGFSQMKSWLKRVDNTTLLF